MVIPLMVVPLPSRDVTAGLSTTIDFPVLEILAGGALGLFALLFVLQILMEPGELLACDGNLVDWPDG